MLRAKHRVRGDVVEQALDPARIKLRIVGSVEPLVGRATQQQGSGGTIRNRDLGVRGAADLAVVVTAHRKLCLEVPEDRDIQLREDRLDVARGFVEKRVSARVANRRLRVRVRTEQVAFPTEVETDGRAERPGGQAQYLARQRAIELLHRGLAAKKRSPARLDRLDQRQRRGRLGLARQQEGIDEAAAECGGERGGIHVAIGEYRVRLAAGG